MIFVFLAVRNNLRVRFGIRRKYAMEANEVEPWPGNQHSQPLHEFQWRHHDMGRAIPIRCLQRQYHLPILVARQAFIRNRTQPQWQSAGSGRHY